MIIVVTAKPESVSPEVYEEEQGCSPGFAESVRKTMDQNALWGWCTVEVLAIDDGEQQISFGDIINMLSGMRVGRAYLGACSYLSSADFICGSGGYFTDLVKEAIHDLCSNWNAGVTCACPTCVA